ncbi:MAG: NAD(P)/FAD-dependent oxidoreductase [Pseudomonadota bacterium]
MNDVYDVAIVGAGMVGASIAWHAAPRARVLVLEQESAAGYHATGRSAALYTEAYGPPAIRALTRASRAFFDAPPSGFCGHPLLHLRGTLLVGRDEDRAALETLSRTLVAEGSPVLLLSGDEIRSRVPVLRPEASVLGVFDAGAFDIDVDGLLQGFVRGARQAGVEFAYGAALRELGRHGGEWTLALADGRRFTARHVVNAAGAWADEVAALAGVARLGIEPRRRSAFLFEPPAGLETAHWPAVIAADESWYFKPDASLLLGSPANADPDRPHDVLADDLDVAIGSDRLETATTLTIPPPRSTWAGLRTFTPDGEPACGFDAGAPGFFWAAGLGGYGIQTAPAFGRLAAALVLGDGVPADVAGEGLALRQVDPARFRTAA